jgi:uncharacterized protein (DUF1778 family)
MKEKPKPARGRPPVNSTSRGRPFSIRLLPTEEQAIREAAEREHDNLSNWIRRTLLTAACK